MAKDPNRLNPPPRGKKSAAPAVAFAIVVLFFAAKGCNTDDPDITPVPPSQTERR